MYQSGSTTLLLLLNIRKNCKTCPESENKTKKELEKKQNTSTDDSSKTFKHFYASEMQFRTLPIPAIAYPIY